MTPTPAENVSLRYSRCHSAGDGACGADCGLPQVGPSLPVVGGVQRVAREASLLKHSVPVPGPLLHQTQRCIVNTDGAAGQTVTWISSDRLGPGQQCKPRANHGVNKSALRHGCCRIQSAEHRSYAIFRAYSMSPGRQRFFAVRPQYAVRCCADGKDST